MQARDMDRLEDLVAPGFRFTAIHLDPEPMSREQWMGAAREGYTIVSFAFEHMDIDVFGDTGVIHARYSQVASFQHTPLSNVFRLTDVWSRQDGRWRVVVRHSSILSLTQLE
jgi:ketosteroid isomerase-like protein